MDELKEKLDEEKDLLNLKKSNGGRILLDSLKNDTDSLINILIREYGKLSHIELLSIISEIKAKKELTEKINNSENNVKILEEELKEDLKDK